MLMGGQDTAFLPTSEKPFPDTRKSAGSERGLQLRDQSLHPALQTLPFSVFLTVADVPLTRAS